MKYNRIIPILLCILTILQIHGDSLDFDEDDLFNTSEIITDNKDVINEELTGELEKESVTFTGNIQSSASYNIQRSPGNNTFETIMSTTGMLDIRLKKGIKAFINIGLNYFPSGLPENHTYILTSPLVIGGDIIEGLGVIENVNTQARIKEFFIDANINNIIYCRIGKQVLAWGRGYLWNPSDLINIERKNLFNLSASREGAYGLKVHIPFGTISNIYGFLDITGATGPEDFAYSGKFEFLLGRTEISLSGWWKKDKLPIFGSDLSSKLFGIDIRGELSLSYGDNFIRFHPENGALPVRDEFITRVCIGGGRSFDIGNKTDLIRIDGEFYYNHGGYDVNMLSPDTYSDPALAETFQLSGYYRANDYGKYYGAVSLAFNEFINRNLALSIQGIGNFSDMSFIAYSEVSFNPIDNFHLKGWITGFFGEENLEYTQSGLLLSPGISIILNY